MTPKQSLVAVQRYVYTELGMRPRTNGVWMYFEDHQREIDALKQDIAEALKMIREYERDIAAAERRGVEKAIEAARKACNAKQTKGGNQILRAHHNNAVNACAIAVQYLSIQQILKGEA